MSASMDSHIILDKELRRDIDAIIQRLKEASDNNCDLSKGGPEWRPILPLRASRERSLAITKLQEAVMWLGMDLKAINDENPPDALPTGSFRKKPVVIQAIQLRWSNWNKVCEFTGDTISTENPARNISVEEVSDTCGEPGPNYIAFDVTTVHGEKATVRHGDWIIPDGKPGTFYPCKPDIFAATYEAQGSAANPYPNSKDPSNAKIDPTADGLKL